ncbi:TM1266 family iron-only hydrogenase system putative regulator [Clostridium sp.]|uniref:TM1266 family iron-only hydrogenase system putative regulator n=1 Tax=Clostridium sp. TaxID=1506 RepID=UPI003216C509
MHKIAVISAILENPKVCQSEFNDVVTKFRGSIRGRMGIPFEEDVSVISIVISGELDEINSLTGRLGNIEGVIVKTSISKKEI